MRTDFTWNQDEHSTGHPLLDCKNKRMIELINQLHILGREDIDNDVVLTILGELVEFADDHLLEETLLSAHNTSGLDHHKHSHTLYLEELCHICDIYEKEGTSVFERIIVFLENWWMNHILKEDVTHKQFLRPALA
ncbi:hemerythrin domain-containing protein [Terasakiella sp. SH-1]|uniref:bacteriohemerythrin n=1 Tax=Terasakiella sp. SH-1 TaxID=2560057 RepID=UPI0010736CE6|nr:hemerythrin domain-containing protein [Terasakiella sp. SH-1]